MHKLKQTLITVLKQHKLLTAALLLLIIGSILLALLPPLVLERIVNRLVAGQSVALSMALLYFAALVLSAAFDAAKEILITVFGQKITKQIRQTMSEKLAKLPAAYFAQHESGKVTSRFVNDVDTVETLFSGGIISMFTDVCKVLSIIVVIFAKSVGLGVLILLVTPLLFLLTRSFQRRMLQAQVSNRVAMSSVNNHVPETLKNIRMVQTFQKEKYMAARYDTYMNDSYAAIEKSNLYDSVYSPIVIYTSCIIISAMMVLAAMGGGMQQFFGLSVGTAVAIIAYVGKVFSPLESIGMEIQNVQSAVAGVKRIEEFLAETEQPTAENTVKEEACVSFSDVSFGYEASQTILQNLSFTIFPGEKVTIAGRTGAGKSTIFKLLLGLYTPWQGEVRVFGSAPSGIPEAQRRGIFGYVEQSCKLVSGTVYDQIALFDASITRDQVHQAARMVGLEETIASLKNGYETPAQPELFSQGQLQLLSIARAVVGNPKILLLDEITANLDSGTEKAVLAAIGKAAENRTVISISHRLYEQEPNSRVIQL